MSVASASLLTKTCSRWFKMTVKIFYVFILIICSSSGHMYHENENPLQISTILQALFTSSSDSSSDMLYNIFSNLMSSFLNYNNIGSMDKIKADFEKGKNCEDAHMSIDELIVKYGYQSERHSTVTEDGYNLTMFRIASQGPPVLLMHGMLASSDDFVTAGPDNALAFLLAKEGYDVWLGNSRGNKHSRRHVELDPSQEQFWSFSWHEIGYYDLPAMIDYILKKTGQKKLKYIGHSQGTTSFFVMASDRPEYNDKIALSVSLAPSVFHSRSRTSQMLKMIAPYNGLLITLSKHFGIYEIFPNSKLPRILVEQAFGPNSMPEIFGTVLSLSQGFDLQQVNFTNLPVIMNHGPSGSSIFQVCHYAQVMVAKKFRKYDHGPEENLKKYGSLTPPDYELNKVTAPVSLVFSVNDWNVHPDDVEELSSKLPNVVDKHKLKYKSFNHVDYLFAKDLKFLLFKRLRKVLAKY